MTRSFCVGVSTDSLLNSSLKDYEVYAKVQNASQDRHLFPPC
jgi:hypothetical protein